MSRIRDAAIASATFITPEGRLSWLVIKAMYLSMAAELREIRGH